MVVLAAAAPMNALARAIEALSFSSAPSSSQREGNLTSVHGHSMQGTSSEPMLLSSRTSSLKERLREVFEGCVSESCDSEGRGMGGRYVRRLVRLGRQ
jgi:hypothetical protein